MLNRRSFLRGFALATTTATLLPSFRASGTSAKASSSHAPALGVASYSFRKFAADDLILLLRDLGTPFLNVKDVHLPMTPLSETREVAGKYRSAGLQLTVAGTIYFTKDDDSDMRPKFDYVKTAGIPLIVGGPTPATLPRLEKFVKEYDVRLAIHNHGPEDKYFPSPLEALKAIKGMDPRMGICIDVGHTARAGVDVPSAIREAGRRLYDVHMKDLVNDHGAWKQVAVGDGTLPVAKIFAALMAAKYQGYIDLEYEIDENNPLPGMIKSFAYMRGVIAGMTG